MIACVQNSEFVCVVDDLDTMSDIGFSVSEIKRKRGPPSDVTVEHTVLYIR